MMSYVSGYLVTIVALACMIGCSKKEEAPKPALAPAVVASPQPSASVAPSPSATPEAKKVMKKKAK